MWSMQRQWENDRETVSRLFLKALSPGNRKRKGKIKNKKFIMEKKSRRGREYESDGEGIL